MAEEAAPNEARWVTSAAEVAATVTTVTTGLLRRADNDSYPGAAPPPPGVTPNLENPADHGSTLNLTIVSICLSLATILFVLRMYVKIRISRHFFWEDAMCILAWVTFVLYCTSVYLMDAYGEGHHTWDIPKHEYSQLRMWLYASTVLYTFGAFLTKVTLLLLIARVFSIRKLVSRAIYAFIFFLILAYSPIQILKIRVCTPIRRYWDPNVPGVCLNQEVLFICDISLAILTDLLILLIPIPLVWRMNSTWRKKLKIMLLLGAGGIAVGVVIFRMVKVVQFKNSRDVAVSFVALDLLTVSELTVGIICACLPSANVLIEHYRTPRYAPNSPRSRRSAGHSTFTWDGLGSVENLNDLPEDHDEDSPPSKATSSSDPPLVDEAMRQTPAAMSRSERPSLHPELAMYPSHPGPP
jgi:hypothetical protein